MRKETSKIDSNQNVEMKEKNLGKRKENKSLMLIVKKVALDLVSSLSGEWKKVKLDTIKTKEELLNLVRGKRLTRFVKVSKEGNLFKLFELEDFKTIGDLINLINGKKPLYSKFAYLMMYKDEFIISKLWELFNVRKVDDLSDLLEDAQVFYIITHLSDSNLSKILGLKGVTKKGLLELFKNEMFFRLVKYVIGNRLSKILELEDLTKETLLKLLKNKNLYYFMCDLEEVIFEKVWEKFEIKTVEDLLEILEDEDLFYFITRVSEEKLSKVFVLEDLTKELLVEISRNEKLVYFLEYTDYEHFDRLWELFNVKKISDLLEIIENENLFDIMTNARKENLSKILGFKNLTKEKLLEIIKNKKNVNLIRYTKENVFEKAMGSILC